MEELPKEEPVLPGEHAVFNAAATAPKVRVYFLALLGGVVGAAAACYQNSLYASGLVVVLVAAVVEEMCKPIALIVMLDKRPRWFTGTTEIVILGLISAMVFASLENLLYIFVIAPGKSAFYAVFRFTVPTALHMTATGIFSVGLAKAWRIGRQRGRRFDIDTCFRYYLIAVAIHAVYNVVAVILFMTGILHF